MSTVKCSVLHFICQSFFWWKYPQCFSLDFHTCIPADLQQGYPQLLTWWTFCLLFRQGHSTETLTYFLPEQNIWSDFPDRCGAVLGFLPCDDFITATVLCTFSNKPHCILLMRWCFSVWNKPFLKPANSNRCYLINVGFNCKKKTVKILQF